jgi:ABC-type branched-subunit amino acid transport system substrate-binding protein
MSEERTVSRREFLKIAGIAGATVGVAGGLGGVLAACGGEETTTTAAAATTTTAAAATTTTAAGATTTTGGATTTVSAAAEVGDPIKVGAINSLTGGNALTGLEHNWAQKQCADDWNKTKGGVKLNDGKVHPIEIKFVDDQSTDTQAAAAAEQLIKSDNIKIILSSNTTPYNQAAATVCEQYQAFYQICTSWIDRPAADGTGPSFIGGMNLKWSADVFEKAATAGLAAVNANKNLDGGPVTKFGVMVENNPDGVGFGDGTVAGLKAQGWEVVSYEKFVEGQKDFSSIILKFQQSGVEGLVVLISPADGITFVNQMKQQGWAPKFIFGYKGFWPVDFMKALGPDSQYIGHDGFWSKDLPFPYCKELGAAFEAAHGGDSSNSVGLSYAASQVLYTAIENAGVFEPGAVRDKVFGQTFKGTTIGDIVYGSVYPEDPGIAYWALLGFQWIDEKRIITAPPEYTMAKTQVMLPWDQR